MSQSVGVNFKSKIPTLGDDASIEEALRVYHYGIDSYSGQPIPTDSIEGNFTSLNSRVTILETTVTGLGTGFVKLISETASPNIITGQSTTTVPLTIRAIAAQISDLQSWQNSSNTNVATLSTAGSFGMAGYMSVGSTTISSTVASSINIINAAHKGIIVKPAVSQTANLQEWQNSAGTAVSWVTPEGRIYVRGSDVETLVGGQNFNPLLLMGA